MFLATRGPKMGLYWPKSNHFWRWSGHSNMPHFRPFLPYVLLRMLENLTGRADGRWPTLCPCCVHNASTVPWTSAGQFGRPRGVRGRPWYDLWRPRCVISHPMDVRGLPPGRPPSGRPRDTQFGIDWSLLPSGCPQGVRTAEVQPITARTHYGQYVRNRKLMSRSCPGKILILSVFTRDFNKIARLHGIDF